jgi:hypothetical protein
MWVVSKTGFYSIVSRDASSGSLTVRARVRSDLDDLRGRYLPELSATEFNARADYSYRGYAPREAVQRAMSAIAADIDYDNFKSEIGRVQGEQREVVYHGVWSALPRLQARPIPEGIPTFYASIGRRPDVLGPDKNENGSKGR